MTVQLDDCWRTVHGYVCTYLTEEFHKTKMLCKMGIWSYGNFFSFDKICNLTKFCAKWGFWHTAISSYLTKYAIFCNHLGPTQTPQIEIYTHKHLTLQSFNTSFIVILKLTSQNITSTDLLWVQFITYFQNEEKNILI